MTGSELKFSCERGYRCKSLPLTIEGGEISREGMEEWKEWGGGGGGSRGGDLVTDMLSSNTVKPPIKDPPRKAGQPLCLCNAQNFP